MGATVPDERGQPPLCYARGVSETVAAAAKIGLSVVIPFYMERDVAGSFVKEVRQVLGAMAQRTELLLVDDGSPDDTFEQLVKACDGDPACKVLRLARNYGQTAALAAGIERAQGEIIVILDGDGQNDPRDIPALLEKLDEGYDVVSGWRKQRKDTFLTRKLPSVLANALVSRLSGVHMHDFGCSLKAYRARYLKGVHLYGEMHRFLVVHAVWEGGRPTEIVVNHRPRTTGKSNYGLERTYKVILDLIVMVFMRRYGTKPIYLFGGFGLWSIFFGFLAGLGAIGFKFAPAPYTKSFVETPLPLLVVMLGLVGLLSILMGLVAEMMTRTYHESQAKPVYNLGEIVCARPGPKDSGVPATEASSSQDGVLERGREAADASATGVSAG